MKLEKFLNERIADFGVIFIKLHRFHWLVEGPDFYPVHAKFQELYEEINELMDEYAERLLSIGGRPVSTMKEFLNMTKISEEGSEVKSADIFKTLIKDYSILVDALKEGIGIAEGEDDDTTADLFISTIGTFEKHLWMFKAILK